MSRLLLIAGLFGALAGAPAAAQDRDHRDLFLRAVAQEVGLFYVFRGACGPCRIASPQIKAFSDAYGVAVSVISTDGGRAPEFASNTRDAGQLSAWGLSPKGTPALLVYQSPTRLDPRTGRPQGLMVQTPAGLLQLRPCFQPRGCVTFLGAGVMPAADIAGRVFDLTAIRATPAP